MVATVAVRGAPTITAPAGWTLIRTDVNGTRETLAAFDRVATASEPASHTWTFSTSEAAAGGILAYAGVDTSNPIDAHGGKVHRKSTSIKAPSITTSANADAIIGFFEITGDDSMIPPVSMTERFDLSSNTLKPYVTAAGADETQPTAGATGARIATAALPGFGIGQLIALRPAGP